MSQQQDTKAIINELKSEIYDTQKQLFMETNKRDVVIVEIARAVGLPVDARSVQYTEILDAVKAVVANQKAPEPEPEPEHDSTGKPVRKRRKTTADK